MNIQQNRIDMAIEPKSDQINYDDFLVGSKNITITDVKSTGNRTDAQPISVHYQGDGGKPFKPCKSMRRVMVRVWGDDPAKYIDRSMTLFGDQDVIFAGKKVGGIRISHMSHMDAEINVPLSASKTKRVLYRVSPLKVDTVDQGFIDDVESAALVAANLGTDKLRAHYNNLPEDEKSIIGKKLNELKDIAVKVGAAPKKETESDQFDDQTGEVIDSAEDQQDDYAKLNLLKGIAAIEEIGMLDAWKRENKEALAVLENMYPDDYKTVMDAFNNKESDLVG